MILPIGAIFPDTRYLYPRFYGVGYGVGGRFAQMRAEVRDAITLSPAALRLIDQAERLNKVNIAKE